MENYSFFDSIVDANGNYDRPTKAIDFDRHFKDLFTNGVFMSPSTNLQVLASGQDMYIAIQSGPAWINGKKYDNDSPLYLAIDTADSASARIDRVVIRCDYTRRAVYAAVIKGAYAQTPAAPALQRDADAYELALADIAVAAGATEIRQADITDLRLNSNLCGLVSFCNSFDTTAIFNQMQDWFQMQVDNFNKDHADWSSALSAAETAFQQQFTTWFDGIKGQLSTDAAGNLQNQITALLNKITADEHNNLLFTDAIKGTVQTVTQSNGQITSVDHKSGSTVIRSDSFNYSDNLITEVRTLNTGETVTFKYHLDTLETEVI